jgi:hypothetical protein
MLASSSCRASLSPCTRVTTPSLARRSCAWPRTRCSGAGQAGLGPLPLDGLRERFLPERAFHGRQNAKLQYAVLAAAAVNGGTEPDLLDEVASWQADDFWQYALYAAVARIRAAAESVNLNEAPSRGCY